jgi:hypothetical protein
LVLVVQAVLVKQQVTQAETMAL